MFKISTSLVLTFVALVFANTDHATAQFSNPLSGNRGGWLENITGGKISTPNTIENWAPFPNQKKLQQDSSSWLSSNQQGRSSNNRNRQRNAQGSGTVYNSLGNRMPFTQPRPQYQRPQPRSNVQLQMLRQQQQIQQQQHMTNFFQQNMNRLQQDLRQQRRW